MQVAHVWSMFGACLGHPLGHVWGINWGMSGASFGACLGASSGACLGHHLGHVWGIIWDNIWVILSTMDNNPRCYMHLWCHFWLNHNIVAGVRYSGEAYYCIWYFSLWIFLIWSESESKRNELEWQVIFQRACSLESAKCTMYKLRCDMYDFWSGTPCPCALHLIVKDLSVKFASVIKLGVNKLKLFLARYCWNHFLFRQSFLVCWGAA